jgi:2-hydroxycyclohexanecarboxyl-CoA dehydrogenase
MELGLSGKVALVTGSGRNVGRAVVKRFALEGAAVVVNDINGERAEAVVKEIRDAGGKAIAAVADITQEDQVRNMVALTEAQLGPVDILVNNAGIPASPTQPDPKAAAAARKAAWVEFHESSPDHWRKTVDINVYGTMFCTHAVLKGMVERKYGKIVSVMSEAGRLGEAKLAAYSGAKASILGFSRAIAREVGPYGVNVNVVSLGAVDPDETPYVERDEQKRVFLDKILRAYPIGQGLKRLSKPSDIADAIAFLSSDRASYITGQVLGLSGGFAMV